MQKRRVRGIIDPYGRPIRSLRISLTQRCNFDCFFCHREGENESYRELTIEEIVELVSIGSELGVSSVKFTGGEPLLRDDIVEIVRRVSSLVEEVSMTTNASKLAGLACSLREAGLNRVNVSLHSMDPHCFERITSNDSMEDVREGIREALRCGLNPVKLNMVVIKGLNAGDIPEMILLSRELGAILQLIEYQPLERGAEDFNKYYFDLRPIEKDLMAKSDRVIEREMHRRKRYHLLEGGVVEVVRPMHNSEFCFNCTRLRVTSDGHLKPCLMRNDNLVDAVTLMRRGAPKEALIEAFKKAVELREPYWRD